MTLLPATVALRQQFSLAEQNSWPKLLAAIGMISDNGGQVAAARSLGLPVSIAGRDTLLQAVCRQGTTGYTVAANTLLCVRYIENGTNPATVNNGTATFNIAPSGVTVGRETCLWLDAGDVLTLGSATSSWIGHEQSHLIQADATRVCTTATATAPYVVPNNTIVYITTMFYNTNVESPILVDGAIGPIIGSLAAASTMSILGMPQPFIEGQVIGPSAAANTLVVSGLSFSRTVI